MPARAWTQHMPGGCTTSVQGETKGAIEFRPSRGLFDRVFLTLTHVKNVRDGKRADWSLSSADRGTMQKGLHSEVQAFFGQPYSLVGSASFELATPAV